MLSPEQRTNARAALKDFHSKSGDLYDVEVNVKPVLDQVAKITMWMKIGAITLGLTAIAVLAATIYAIVS